MSLFRGVRVNIGIDSEFIGVQGAFQLRDHRTAISSEEIKNVNDQTISKVYWDYKEEASYVYIAIALGNSPFQAPVTFPRIGRGVTVIDHDYPQIAGRWLVDEIETRSSNQSALRVIVKLSRYPLITNIQ